MTVISHEYGIQVKWKFLLKFTDGSFPHLYQVPNIIHDICSESLVGKHPNV